MLGQLDLTNNEIEVKLKAHYQKLCNSYAQEIQANDKQYEALSLELLTLIGSCHRSRESNCERLIKRVHEISERIGFLQSENRRLHERQMLLIELVSNPI